jgi:molybdate transport system substrate-binding protein
MMRGGRGQPAQAVVLVALLLAFASPLRAEEVVVFAAASLTDVLEEIGHDFEGASSHHVVFAFGSSGDLARQIWMGARADVFFSADIKRMDELERAGLVRAGDRVNVLSNVLVVVVPASSTSSLRTPKDLLRLPRMAVADPEVVPAGFYARSYFEKIGLWAALRPKVVPSLDVRAALAAVASGSIPAGVVYRTDARGVNAVRVAFEVPPEEGPAIVYPLAPLAASAKLATREFVRFLLLPSTRAIYEKHGFLVLARK